MNKNVIFGRMIIALIVITLMMIEGSLACGKIHNDQVIREVNKKYEYMNTPEYQEVRDVLNEKYSR